MRVSQAYGYWNARRLKAPRSRGERSQIRTTECYPPAREWDAEGLHYETLAICRSLALARAALVAALAEKPAGRFTIRSRMRVMKRHPEGDW